MSYSLNSYTQSTTHPTPSQLLTQHPGNYWPNTQPVTHPTPSKLLSQHPTSYSPNTQQTTHPTPSQTPANYSPKLHPTLDHRIVSITLGLSLPSSARRGVLRSSDMPITFPLVYNPPRITPHCYFHHTTFVHVSFYHLSVYYTTLHNAS